MADSFIKATKKSGHMEGFPQPATEMRLIKVQATLQGWRDACALAYELIDMPAVTDKLKKKPAPAKKEASKDIARSFNKLKTFANDYDTKMTGLKLKIAPKRADKGKWSTSGSTQRKHLISFRRGYRLARESVCDFRICICRPKI